MEGLNQSAVGIRNDLMRLNRCKIDTEDLILKSYVLVVEHGSLFMDFHGWTTNISTT